MRQASDSRRSGLRRRLLGAAAAVVLSCAGWQAAAQAPPRLGGNPPRGPVMISADQMTFDQDRDVAVAMGNVEIVQGERVLRADQVTYDRRNQRVIAAGNVSLLEVNGDIAFADRVELSDDLRDGIAQNISLLLSDQSRMVAASARRADGRVTVMRDVVYSPCELCATDPERAPTWQIRADRVIHDQAAQRVIHRDARFEVFGVPVFWLPAFWHPDGSAERQSGFLMPDIRSSSRLGQFITVPYFLTLGPHADLTIAPIFLTRDAPVLAGEFRRRYSFGEVRLNGSITSAQSRDAAGNEIPGRDTRWHVGGYGRFALDNDWRLNFDLQRASDPTYLSRYGLLRRYGFQDQNTLTSEVHLERFVDRNYFAADIYAFQGLRPEDDGALMPYVLPQLRYRWTSNPMFGGSRLTFESGLLSVWRREGSRTQRLSVAAGWTLPYVSEGGHVFRISANLRGELYNADNIGNAAETFRPTREGARGRFFPQVAAEWSYPVARRIENTMVVIEPTIQFVAAPYVNDQDRFPNEDSRSIDYDDTSLFRVNRFGGVDRLEGGVRAAYGLRFAVTRLGGGRITGFIGHGYRFTERTDFTGGTGLEQQSSDIVGRISVEPHPWFAAAYRFRLDSQDLSQRRGEITLLAGPSYLRVSGSYVFVDRRTQSGLTRDIAQLSGQVDLRISENLRLQARHIRDLSGGEAGALYTAFTGVYEDECVVLAVDVSRRNYGRADNPPDTQVIVRLALRNLGEFGFRF